VKILFVMLHAGFVRNYERPLRALAAAGHQIHVACEWNRNKLGEDVLIARLAESSDRITSGSTPSRAENVRLFLARVDRSATRSGRFGRVRRSAETESSRDQWPRNLRAETWESLATTVRLLLDYLRYFEPAYAPAAQLRQRAEKRLPQLYVGLVRLVSWAGRPARALLVSILRGLERVIPINSAVDAFIRRHDPDLLLVTPLIDLGSQQVDYLKCAERLGIRSALCVASWDNLTNKGVVRVVPDHVLVWNEIQRREAVTFHGVSTDRVLVTGGQLFDHWFDARPSRPCDDFCRRVGLPSDRPFLLYVGSSQFIAPNEVPFVERWISRIRTGGDARLATMGILLRPHPANVRPWRTLDVAAFQNVAIWPSVGTGPYSPDSDREYFDSLYHSAAVVGVNTSALIEAGIVGRPVFTIRAPEFVDGQDGTLHFQYLLGVEGGLVHAADTLDEHVGQLTTVLQDGVGTLEREKRFVQAFIRPFGLDVPASPVFVQAIETILKLPRPAAQTEPWWVRLVRPLVWPVARAARVLAEDRPLWAYPMRLVVSVLTWTAALAIWIREGIRTRSHPMAKRIRRRSHVIWYESTQRLGKLLKRGRKSLARGIHSARLGARRLARRRGTTPQQPGKRKSA
jgi:hypothetical protein